MAWGIPFGLLTRESFSAALAGNHKSLRFHTILTYYNFAAKFLGNNHDQSPLFINQLTRVCRAYVLALGTEQTFVIQVPSFFVFGCFDR